MNLGRVPQCEHEELQARIRCVEDHLPDRSISSTQPIQFVSALRKSLVRLLIHKLLMPEFKHQKQPQS